MGYGPHVRRIPDPNDRLRETLLRQLLANPTDHYRPAMWALPIEQIKILINPDAVARSLKIVAPSMKRPERKKAIFDISYMASVHHGSKSGDTRRASDLRDQQNGTGKYKPPPPFY